MEENNANKQNLRDAKRDKSKDSCNAKTCDGVTDQSRKSIDSKKDFLTPQDLQQVAADCIVPKAEDIESASIKLVDENNQEREYVMIMGPIFILKDHLQNVEETKLPFQIPNAEPVRCTIIQNQDFPSLQQYRKFQNVDSSDRQDPKLCQAFPPDFAVQTNMTLIPEKSVLPTNFKNSNVKKGCNIATCNGMKLKDAQNIEIQPNIPPNTLFKVCTPSECLETNFKPPDDKRDIHGVCEKSYKSGPTQTNDKDRNNLILQQKNIMNNRNIQPKDFSNVFNVNSGNNPNMQPKTVHLLNPDVVQNEICYKKCLEILNNFPQMHSFMKPLTEQSISSSSTPISTPITTSQPSSPLKSTYQKIPNKPASIVSSSSKATKSSSPPRKDPPQASTLSKNTTAGESGSIQPCGRPAATPNVFRDFLTGLPGNIPRSIYIQPDDISNHPLQYFDPRVLAAAEHMLRTQGQMQKTHSYCQPIQSSLRAERDLESALLSAEYALDVQARKQTPNLYDDIKKYEQTTFITPQKEKSSGKRIQPGMKDQTTYIKPTEQKKTADNLLLSDKYELESKRQKSIDSEALPYPLSNFYPTVGTQTYSDDFIKQEEKEIKPVKRRLSDEAKKKIPLQIISSDDFHEVSGEKIIEKIIDDEEDDQEVDKERKNVQEHSSDVNLSESKSASIEKAYLKQKMEDDAAKREKRHPPTSKIDSDTSKEEKSLPTTSKFETAAKKGQIRRTSTTESDTSKEAKSRQTAQKEDNDSSLGKKSSPPTLLEERRVSKRFSISVQPPTVNIVANTDDSEYKSILKKQSFDFTKMDNQADEESIQSFKLGKSEISRVESETHNREIPLTQDEERITRKRKLRDKSDSGKNRASSIRDMLDKATAKKKVNEFEYTSEQEPSNIHYPLDEEEILELEMEEMNENENKDSPEKEDIIEDKKVIIPETMDSIEKILEKLNQVSEMEQSYSMAQQVAVVTKKMEQFREFGYVQEHALKEILEEEMDDGNIAFEIAQERAKIENEQTEAAEKKKQSKLKFNTIEGRSSTDSDSSSEMKRSLSRLTSREKKMSSRELLRSVDIKQTFNEIARNSKLGLDKIEPK